MLLSRVTDAPTKPLGERGVSYQVFNPERDCRYLDLRVNELAVDSGAGPYHYHSNADNIYLVLEGDGEVTVEGVRHPVTAGDAMLISPGERHDIENVGKVPLRVLEVKVPAESDFIFTEKEGNVTAPTR